MYKEIRLKRGKEESLKRFHPWVFSGAILKIDEGVSEGDVVRVLANSGDFIAVGHYQEGSIAVRVLSFSDVKIDDDFWHSRLSSALKMRQAIGIADNPDNNTYRLVHGEGDNLPGLVVDIYGQTAVMQAHSIGMHLARVSIAEQLQKVMQGRIENVYPVWQALAGHKRRIPLAVVLPRPARGAGTLIPSAQRFVWAAKQPLGNAALGALFA